MLVCTEDGGGEGSERSGVRPSIERDSLCRYERKHEGGREQEIIEWEACF